MIWDLKKNYLWIKYALQTPVSGNAMIDSILKWSYAPPKMCLLLLSYAALEFNKTITNNISCKTTKENEYRQKFLTGGQTYSRVYAIWSETHFFGQKSKISDPKLSDSQNQEFFWVDQKNISDRSEKFYFWSIRKLYLYALYIWCKVIKSLTFEIVEFCWILWHLADNGM